MKKIRNLLFITALASGLFLVNCGEEDLDLTCAGCDSSAPWSVPGSTECYRTVSDCEASETGNCTICD